MGHIGDKKRTSRNQDNLVSVPEYLRNFIEGISLKTDEAEPQRKPKQIKQVENESNPAQKLNKNKGQQLTDLEIVELWSSFKVGFPEGQISKPQIMEVVRKVFPRCDADIVLKNVFRVFDQGKSKIDKIDPRDLMLAFTMAMSGSIDEKLHWTFRMYDVDGNGEIDIFEMEKMFVILCSIVECSEKDQLKRNKLARQRLEKETKLKREREELKAILYKQKMLEESKYKVNILSTNFKNKINRQSFTSEPGKSTLDTRRTKSAKSRNDRRRNGKDYSEETKQKVSMVKEMASDLADPSRDCKKFNHKKRAQELFIALDDDGNGGITEKEFISGCKTDEAFVKLLTELSPEFIWGYASE